jgi:hypothetical protein
MEGQEVTYWSVYDAISIAPVPPESQKVDVLLGKMYVFSVSPNQTQYYSDELMGS